MSTKEAEVTYLKNISMGRNLLIMMAKRNVKTAIELGAKADVSRATISKIINNESVNISLQTLVKLCVALDCEASDLIDIKRDAG